MKETEQTACFASFLTCLKFENKDHLSTKIYDRRDDFDLNIINFSVRQCTFVSCVLCLYFTIGSLRWFPWAPWVSAWQTPGSGVSGICLEGSLAGFLFRCRS